LSIFRLGLDAESMAKDELLHEFPRSRPTPQPIHPGSYIHVAKNVRGQLKELTLECWVRPWKLKDWAGLITQFDEQQGREFGLLVGPSGRISFCLGNQMNCQTAAEHVSGKNGINADRWHHILATWDGRDRQIFINGELAGKWPFSDVVRVGKIPLRLGAAGYAGRAGLFLDGDMAMPAIYGKALSPSEVIARFEQAGSAAPRGKRVLAAWTLSEEQGERVADSSGRGHHGA